jgi:hypothetical protein
MDVLDYFSVDGKIFAVVEPKELFQEETLRERPYGDTGTVIEGRLRGNGEWETYAYGFERQWHSLEEVKGLMSRRKV